MGSQTTFADKTYIDIDATATWGLEMNVGVQVGWSKSLHLECELTQMVAPVKALGVIRFSQKKLDCSVNPPILTNKASIQPFAYTHGGTGQKLYYTDFFDY